jgi:hypothetical protein
MVRLSQGCRDALLLGRGCLYLAVVDPGSNFLTSTVVRIDKTT